MPIYCYQLKSPDSGGCEHCRAGFDALQKLIDAPLHACPECGAAVVRVIAAPNVVSGQAHLLKTDNIGKKGFTQYRKVGKGVYEKTTGKGPDYISGD